MIYCVFVFLSSSSITALAFVLFEANTISEYGAAIYSFISESHILYIFFIQLCQMPNILELIENFGGMIKEKSNYIFLHSSLKIQVQKYTYCMKIYTIKYN